MLSHVNTRRRGQVTHHLEHGVDLPLGRPPHDGAVVAHLDLANFSLHLQPVSHDIQVPAVEGLVVPGAKVRYRQSLLREWSNTQIRHKGRYLPYERPEEEEVQDDPDGHLAATHLVQDAVVPEAQLVLPVPQEAADGRH